MSRGVGRRALLRAAAATPLAAGVAAHAQGTLPRGPLRIVVGFAAGGSADVVARLVAERLRERTGLVTIIDNKLGISGVIATEAVAKAVPDGNTVVLAAMASTIMGKLTFAKLPYDPQKDLSPVTLVATFPLALAVTPSLPANDLAGFVAWARANPTRASYGVPALGGHSHFFGLLLGKAIGVDMQPVPYKGSVPMIADLGAGQIQVGISGLSDFFASYKPGRVRLLASSGAKRAESTPELPTFAEQGYPNLVGEGWLGLYAPAGTADGLREALAREVTAILRLPDVRQRIVDMGMDPVGGTPEELATFDERERQRWAPIVAASGFKVE